MGEEKSSGSGLGQTKWPRATPVGRMVEDHLNFLIRSKRVNVLTPMEVLGIMILVQKSTHSFAKEF